MTGDRASGVGLPALRTLFDYGYWATERLLEAAAALPPEQFRAAEPRLTRSLRATLVHELDVEWSWRERVLGVPDESELDPESYESVAALAAAWQADAATMRSWLDGLDDAALAAVLPGRRRYAIRDILLHMLIHGMQQRADAAALLTLLGASPGEIDFLDYLDARAETDGADTRAADPEAPGTGR